MLKDSDDEWASTAPEILVPYGADQIGYKDYYYLYRSSNPEKKFWFDAEGEATVDEETTIAPGTAIWIWHNGDSPCTVTFAGKVLSDSSRNAYTAAGIWAFIANPYPMALDIISDKISYDGIEAVLKDSDDEWATTAPEILIPYGNGQVGYKDYYYLYRSSNPDKKFWFDAEAEATVEEGVAVIPVGSGAWFCSQKDVTITFTR